MQWLLTSFCTYMRFAHRHGPRTRWRDAQGRWHVRGRVMNLIPLRNRREELVTRISEGMTEWTLDDGRKGYGLSEYLDQIIDGKPVGLDE